MSNSIWLFLIQILSKTYYLIMKSIILIVPYFGKLPSNFQLWLEGCRFNPSIDWLLFIDDSYPYSYPKNVTVIYTYLKKIKKRIQELYPFPIMLERPYKLCDYRVAYGEIFKEEIHTYQFWGYCDIDLLFGDIRKFITDDILETFEKIGFQGHLTIFRNSPDVVKRYRQNINTLPTYKDIFTNPASCMFDEDIIDAYYDHLKIPVFKKVYFAHLLKYHKDFHLGHLPKEEEHKNNDNIFSWHQGKLYRHYIANGSTFENEMLYIHFFCREMKIKIHCYNKLSQIIIYPNCIEEYDGMINETLIRKKAHISIIIFKLKYLYKNRHKLSFRKILDYMEKSRKELRG